MEPANGSNSEDDTPIIVEDDLTIVKTCLTCHREFDAPAASFAGRLISPVKLCQGCTQAAESLRIEDERRRILAVREARFEKICPPEYRSEGIRAAMPKAKATAIRDLVKAGRGSLAIGPTGSFKTTCTFSAVRWLIAEGHEVEYMTAARFRQRASFHAKEGTIEGFIRQLARVPWLFLDDIGNASSTPAAQEALLELFEHRVAAGSRPILATSQFGGEELIAKFTPIASGEAIVRRLGLLATPVLFP